MDSNKGSWRRGVGIAAILALIAVWVLAIALFAPLIARWPVLVQAPFYLIVGVVWIIPLKPLLQWMETGSFRPPRG